MRPFVLILLLLCSQKTHADRLTPLIGATLMVGWPGTSPADPSSQLLCRQLARGEVGGVLFLGHNMETVAQVSELTRFFARCGARFKPLLALDQEGGAVDRLGSLPGERSWPSAAKVGGKLHQDFGPLHSIDLYTAMAQRVADLGFTVNFGPVVDLNSNPNNPVIGALGRAYSQAPYLVNHYASTFILGHERAKIATAIKHFPGHGSAQTDSHNGFTDITQSWTYFEVNPFFLIGKSTSSAIMVGHLVHLGFDRSARPASLSAAFLEDWLRKAFHFDGVIVSDDMAMRAITDHYGFEQSVQLGLSAGLDIYLHSNSGPYSEGFVAAYHTAVRSAIEQGVLRQEDLRSKAARIAAWKP